MLRPRSHACGPRGQLQNQPNYRDLPLLKLVAEDKACVAPIGAAETAVNMAKALIVAVRPFALPIDAALASKGLALTML